MNAKNKPESKKSRKELTIYRNKSGIFDLWYYHPVTGARNKTSTGTRNEVDAHNWMLNFDLDAHIRKQTRKNSSTRAAKDRSKDTTSATTGATTAIDVPSPSGGMIDPDLTVEAWLMYDEGHYDSKSTRSYFRSAYRSFLKAVPRTTVVSELTPVQINQWKESMKAKPVAHNYYVIVKASFQRWARATDGKNPLDRVDTPKPKNKGRTNKRQFAWSLQEQEAILSATKVFYDRQWRKDNLRICLYPVIRIGLNSGMRTDEILHLRWSDIDWKAGTMKVINDPTHHQTKTRAERTLKMSPELIAFLGEHRMKLEIEWTQNRGMNEGLRERILREFPDLDPEHEGFAAFLRRYYKHMQDVPDEQIFTRNRKQSDLVVDFRNMKIRESSISHTFRDFMDKVELEGITQDRKDEILLYHTRHTWGTAQVDNGCNLIDLMYAMGHSSITTTQLYLEPKVMESVVGI